jgi:hypothetical protein
MAQYFAGFFNSFTLSLEQRELWSMAVAGARVESSGKIFRTYVVAGRGVELQTEEIEFESTTAICLQFWSGMVLKCKNEI